MSAKEYVLAVYIGRFQPFHRGHLAVVEHGLSIADRVLVVVGSSNAAPTPKNPWSLAERREMILGSLHHAGYKPGTRGNTIVCGVRDYFYSDTQWLTEVQHAASTYAAPGDAVALIGSFKDASSGYLNSFPQWDFVHTPPGCPIVHGSTIRRELFATVPRKDWEGTPTPIPPIPEDVPTGAALTITKWMSQPLYRDLCLEEQFLREYQKAWQDAPYPPTFVTADAVVTCAGHVLVVKRRDSPGKGLYAVPGGFVKQNETVRTAALRELREETGIRVNPIILESQIVDSRVFDHPGRSLRGRTISHAFHVALRDGPLPEVRGGDDAAEAKWMPLWDAWRNEHLFFEDHAHIINSFTTR